MVSPSRCPPWQPERPGPTRREPRRAQRSYTTRRDTIASIHNHFNQERHLYNRGSFKLNRSAALAEWRQLAV